LAPDRPSVWPGRPADQPPRADPRRGTLVLTYIPLTRYRGGVRPDYFWPSLAVLLMVWQLWDHRRLAWAVLTVATAAAVPIYGLSVAGVIKYVLPGWWMLITGAADLLALAILLGSPIRRWVAKQPAPLP
jgi:hypothetical protein